MKSLILVFSLLLSLYSYSQDTIKNVHSDGSIEYRIFSTDSVLETSIYITSNFHKWTCYYDNGNVNEIAFYVNGLKEGRWEKYNRLGELVHFAYYTKGRLTRVEKFFPNRLALR